MQTRWQSIGTVLALILALVITQVVVFAQPKTQLIIEVRSGPEAAGTGQLVAYWNANLADKFGFTVQQVEDSRAAYYAGINTRIFAKSSSPDIALSYSNYTALYAKAGAVVDITSWFNDNSLYPYNRQDFFPVALQLVTDNDHIYALPTDTNTFFLFYRKDLIPNPPSTWDELLNVAKEFTKKYNSKSPTDYGLAFYGRREESTAMFWYQIFKSYGGEFFDKEGNPQFASEAGVKALNVVQSAVREELVPPDISTYEYTEILGGLQSGKVAMGIEWGAAFPTLINPKDSPLVWDKIGAALVPGVRQPDGSIERAQSTHDLMLVINAGSRYPKKAFQFIAWATGAPEALQIYTKAGDNPPHFSIYDDPQVQQLNPLFKIRKEAFVKWGYIEPMQPSYPQMKDILTSYLLEAFSLQVSAKDALTLADKQIKAVMLTSGWSGK